MVAAPADEPEQRRLVGVASQGIRAQFDHDEPEHRAAGERERERKDRRDPSHEEIRNDGAGNLRRAARDGGPELTFWADTPSMARGIATLVPSGMFWIAMAATMNPARPSVLDA